MNYPLAISAAFIGYFLPSCATKFTAAQREELSTLAISPVEVPGNAYSEPYGGDRQAASSAGMVGVTSGTGAIGGAVGSLVGEAIAATQDNMYRGSHKNQFDEVQHNTPQVGAILETKLKSAFKADPFFGSRLRNDSPNKVVSKVTSYRLVRGGKDKDGELLMMPQIVAEIKLSDGSGKMLAGGTYVGSGYQNLTSVYAESAAKTKEGYEFAAKMAVDSFTTLLAKKLEK